MGLPNRQRVFAIVAVFLAMLGTAAIDAAVSPAVELRPLAYIFVIVISALGGFRLGLFGALLGAAAFTAAEERLGAPMPTAANALLFLLGLSVAVFLVEIIRDQTASAQRAKTELDFAKKENEALRQANEREHKIADALQRTSLPASLPEIPGVQVHAYYAPGAGDAQIGGDWYDAFQMPDGSLALSIGDVAGKGLQAASTMSMVRLALRAAALEGLRPSQVLARANQILLNERPTMVTAVFGLLNPINGQFTCAVAGHPMPLVVGANGDVQLARPMSPPLGVVNGRPFAEQTMDVGLGSLLVLYTDGLTEFKHDLKAGALALINAAREALRAGSPEPALLIGRTLVGGEPNDDVAVLTVSIAGEALRELDLTLTAVPASSRLFRHALRRLYVGVGLKEERILMLQVAVGEALMNSIEHAYGIRGGPIRVHGYVKNGELVIEVSDRGRWRPPRDDGRGRGLQIISGLAQHADVHRTTEGTLVRLVEPLSGVPA